MAEVTIRQPIWQEFERLARRLGRNPQTLAETALRAFVQRLADDELDTATRRAAQKASFRIQDTEAIIRKIRKEKLSRVKNGHTKKTNASSS